MFISHMKTLNETGLALIQKAQTLGKVSEIEKCLSLGTDLLAQARAILAQEKENSIMVFTEFCVNLEIGLDYRAYCAFCVRNKMTMFSAQDFEAYTENILKLKVRSIEAE